MIAKRERNPLVSRRSFLLYSAASASAAILTACGSGSSAPSSTPDIPATVQSSVSKTQVASTGQSISPTPRGVPTIASSTLTQNTSASSSQTQAIIATAFKAGEISASDAGVMLEDGYKLYQVRFILEFAPENQNITDGAIDISMESLLKATLATKEGFNYSPTPLVDRTKGATYIAANYTGYLSTYYPTLPKGFRIRGELDDTTPSIGAANPKASDTDGYTNRVTFKIGKTTTPVKLSIPNDRNTPSVIIDLTKPPVDIASVKFPTDIPDSVIKDLEGAEGAEVAWNQYVSSSFESITSELDKEFSSGSAKVTVGFRFHNKNAGIGQRVLLRAKIFGDDGILYTSSVDGSEFRKQFGPSPNFDSSLFRDGAVIDSDDIGPGSDKAVSQAVFTVSQNLKQGILALVGPSTNQTPLTPYFRIKLPTPQ